MVAITTAEKKAVCERFPDVHIARTMRQDSKRHHYYMTEDPAPLEYLSALREDKYGVTRKGHCNDRLDKKRR